MTKSETMIIPWSETLRAGALGEGHQPPGAGGAGDCK